MKACSLTCFVGLLASCSLADPAGEVKKFLKSELAPFNGGDGKPIYMGLQGLVFDVSSGENFYGVGAAYEVLASRESTRAVALMSLEPDDIKGEDDMTGIGAAEREEMKDIFEGTYVTKYPLVGLITDSQAIPPGKMARTGTRKWQNWQARSARQLEANRICSTGM